jgi:hypothetical protein
LADRVGPLEGIWNVDSDTKLGEECTEMISRAFGAVRLSKRPLGTWMITYPVQKRQYLIFCPQILGSYRHPMMWRLYCFTAGHQLIPTKVGCLHMFARSRSRSWTFVLSSDQRTIAGVKLACVDNQDVHVNQSPCPCIPISTEVSQRLNVGGSIALRRFQVPRRD